jgi:hypothetical protein
MVEHLSRMLEALGLISSTTATTEKGIYFMSFLFVTLKVKY